MTDFEMWLKACEEFHCVIYCHDGEGDTGIYTTWQEVEPCKETGWMSTRKNIMSHVWIDGKHEVVCPNFNNAWMVWERRKRYGKCS